MTYFGHFLLLFLIFFLLFRDGLFEEDYHAENVGFVIVKLENSLVFEFFNSLP